jgi:hypothetical protein
VGYWAAVDDCCIRHELSILPAISNLDCYVCRGAAGRIPVGGGLGYDNAITELQYIRPQVEPETGPFQYERAWVDCDHG